DHNAFPTRRSSDLAGLRRAAGHPAAAQAEAGKRAGQGVCDRKVSVDLTEAYRQCERITWTQARNFAYGIRLLPADKRRGLAVIYAFARRIDDIGDGTMPAEQKIAALEQARRAVLDLPEDTEDPVLLALDDVTRKFPVPLPAFGELIDGCVADVRGTSYQTFEDLLHYCRCVAGSIGRLSLGIFVGSTSRDAGGDRARLADSL